jgi:hypothetical protein
LIFDHNDLMSDPPPNPRVQDIPALVDTRIIEFGHSTIILALESIGARLLKLPLGRRIAKLELDCKTTSFKVIYAGGAIETVDDAQLATIMIAYCIAARLPIPRTANKAVNVTERGVTMRFTSVFVTPPWL